MKKLIALSLLLGSLTLAPVQNSNAFTILSGSPGVGALFATLGIRCVGHCDAASYFRAWLFVFALDGETVEIKLENIENAADYNLTTEEFNAYNSNLDELELAIFNVSQNLSNDSTNQDVISGIEAQRDVINPIAIDALLKVISNK